MSDIFCVIPWNQLFVRASRKFGLCCLSDYLDKESSTFEEHWNSEGMKKIRLDMLNNTPSNICKNCLINNNTTRPAYIWHNRRAKKYESQIKEQTKEDGSTTYFPKTIDIRTDLCNFKCRTCWATSSTSLRQLMRDNGKELSLRTDGKIDNIDQTGLTLDNIKKLQFITWAGGEPFMSPIHWEVMDKLVETGNTKAKIFYHTNLSFPGNTIDRAINLLRNFSTIKLQASLDGSGKDAEYIREGLDYHKFVDNLKLIKKELPHILIQINFTSTSIGLLSLKDVIQLCIDNDLDFWGSNELLSENHPLSKNVLKSEVFDDALNKAIETSNGFKVEEQMKTYNDYIRTKYHPTIYDKELLKSQESMYDKVGYFEKRMKGFLNE